MERREQQIEITTAEFTDLERLCEIYSTAFGETEPTPIHFRKILEDPNITYRVIKVNGVIQGSATLITISKILRTGSRMGLIEDVAISEDTRGLGLGKLLIEDLFEIAVEKGCYKTVLNCSDDNIKFYEKCGMYLAENQMRWDRPKKQN